jgi:hypothetical protein
MMPVAEAGLVRRLCQLVVLSFFSELTETRPYGTHVNRPRRHHTGPDNRKSRTCTSSSLRPGNLTPTNRDVTASTRFFLLVTPYLPPRQLKNGAMSGIRPFRNITVRR